MDFELAKRLLQVRSAWFGFQDGLDVILKDGDSHSVSAAAWHN